MFLYKRMMRTQSTSSDEVYTKASASDKDTAVFFSADSCPSSDEEGLKTDCNYTPPTPVMIRHTPLQSVRRQAPNIVKNDDAKTGIDGRARKAVHFSTKLDDRCGLRKIYFSLVYNASHHL